MKVDFLLDRANRVEILQAAQLAIAIGLDLDKDDLQTQSGFKMPDRP